MFEGFEEFEGFGLNILLVGHEVVDVEYAQFECSGDEACGVDACLVFAEESFDEVVLAFLNGLDAEGHAL